MSIICPCGCGNTLLYGRICTVGARAESEMVNRVAEAMYLTQFPNGSFIKSMEIFKNKYRNMAKVAISICKRNSSRPE